MSKEKALEVAANYISNPSNTKIYVTLPDQAVYLNSDLALIEQHAKRHNLTLHVIRETHTVQPNPKKKLNGK